MAKKDQIWNVCANPKCGRKFPAKRRTQKFCSDDCRVQYYEEHYFVKTTATKTCPNCGNPFTTTSPKKQVYCTPECREEAQKTRLEEGMARYEAERQTFLAERYEAFEHDEFKCTVCGRGVSEGAALDVYEEEGRLKTICTNCKIGKEAL